MINTEYGIAYVEVLEILKCIPIDDYNKIPKNKIELLKKYANSNYTFNYDPNKTLDEQNVSKIAKCIIALLFRDYWSNESQREIIITKQNNDRKELEEEKRKKYNPDNVFNNNCNKKEQSLIVIKNEKWYKKIVNFFKKFLRK